MLKLFLLQSGFTDSKYPGQQFICPDCLMMEGYLSVYPQLVKTLEISRIAYPKPRPELTPLLGDAQSCPVLILDKDVSEEDAKLFKVRQSAHGTRFINSVHHILSYLAREHGLASTHP